MAQKRKREAEIPSVCCLGDCHQWAKSKYAQDHPGGRDR